MRPTATFLLALLFAAALPVSAQERLGPTFDPLTAEPVPYGFDAAPADYSAPRGGDPLVPSQYLASGATKLVRATNTELGSFVYQDGAYLISADLLDAPDGEAQRDTLLLPAQPSDMVVQGGVGYLALRKGQGLLIVDVSDPDDLRVVSQAEGRDLLSIAVADGYAYAGRGTSGIVVYDVADPANPTEVSSQASAGSSNGTWVDGTTLYVAAGVEGLRTFSLADPANPTLLGTFGTDDVFCTYVAVRDGVAYLTGGFGLIAADVTDPAMPAEIGSFSTNTETTYEIAFDGDAAYLPGLDGLRRVDISDLTMISETAIVPGNQFLTVDLGGEEGLAYPITAQRFQGAYAFSTDLGTEQLYLQNAGFTNKLFFDGDLLYATDLAGQLRIVDTSGETAREVGRLDVPPNTQGLHVADGYAYVTDADFGGTGFTVVDVSDPQSPAIVGSYGEANQAFGVDVAGTTAYVAFGFSGIVALDVSDPTDPTLLGSYFFGANAFDVAVRDDIAYVASFGGGMLTLDVSDPANITLIQQVTAWGFLNAIDLENEIFPIYAFVADGQQGLRVVDISDPADLMTTDTGATASQARDVSAIGDFGSDFSYARIHVADDFFGIREFQSFIFDDGEVDEVASFESTDRGIGVASRRDFDGTGEGLVALAAGETGIYFFDLPAFPVANEGGASAETFALDAAYPNPFAATTTLRYTLPEATDVTFAVYDVLGRRVAVLAEGALPAGTREATFDAAGLPSGVYFARLTAGAQTQTQKLLVVR